MKSTDNQEKDKVLQQAKMAVLGVFLENTTSIG